MREKYLFGPVPSRRLGLSLGVDIVPFKTCSLDCVYCQLAKTSEKTIERKNYCDVGAVLDELKKRLGRGLQADFISISGSGEPTLNAGLGQIIDGIKKITDVPVAILTNGTLLYRQDVRADCAKADVVLPSLDAGDEQTYQKINRPYLRLSIEKLIAGLCAFRNEFAGQIALEVFLLEGFNTDTEQIGKIKGAIERIRPDKIQLNTATRPTAEAGIKRLDTQKLEAIAEELGEKCEVVSSSCVVRVPSCVNRNAQYAVRNTILSMLKRRPCSLNDICTGLGLGSDEALKYITHFQQRGLVHSKEKDGIVFFRAN
ncbi:MAG TPA: radical SAM protein [Phycisphaerales bacterium]|nr:radical SAM protein [Phycisphaerales bacterium]